MIPFSDYVKIKNNYCIRYVGECDEYLVQLRLLIPKIKQVYPELEFYVVCRDDKRHFLEGVNVCPISRFKLEKHKFPHVYELFHDVSEKKHPIEKLLEECEIDNIEICNQSSMPTTNCIFVTTGRLPTRSLNNQQIKRMEAWIKNKYPQAEIEYNKNNLEGAGWVLGVESWQIYEAASRGIKTTLVPTGLGTNLYKRMFPQGEIMTIS